MWPGPGEVCAFSLLSLAFWIIPFLWAKSLFERKGFESHWNWLAFVPVIGLPVLFAAFLLPNRNAEAHYRQDSISKELPDLPARMHQDFTYLLTFVSLWIFGNPSVEEDEEVVPPVGSTGTTSKPGLQPSALVGDLEQDSETDLDSISPWTTVIAAGILGLPIILMLLIPVIAGFLCWYSHLTHQSTEVFLFVFLGTIVSTALLGYWDMHRLILAAPDNHAEARKPISQPFSSFLQILGFWFPGYALHFIGRRHYGGRNLMVPALVSMAAFLVPTVGAWFNQPTLPPIGSQDVLASILERIKEHPSYQNRANELEKCTFDQPTEISFDAHEEKRLGKVRMFTPKAKATVYFSVEWRDPSKTKLFISISRISR